jgi:3-methyladenine DNA glycosylase AlkD
VTQPRTQSRPNSSPQHIVAAIKHALAPHANRARADFVTAVYAPSRLRMLGISVPEMRAVVRRFSRDLADRPPRDILAIAAGLVAGGTTEGRQVGYELIAARPDVFERLDAAAIERLGAGNDNWASVDGFAAYIAGPAWRLGLVDDRDVRRWADSSDDWWRRTGLVATVSLNTRSRGGTGDARRTLAVCSRFVGERNPMLAKALSWALRALAPHDPHAVRAFLDRHGDRLPALVRREVMRKIMTGKKQ